MIPAWAEQPGLYVIGLCGPAGSGKSHLARVFEQGSNASVVFERPLSYPLRAWWEAAFPELADLNHAPSDIRARPLPELNWQTWRDVIVRYARLVRSVDPHYFVKSLHDTVCAYSRSVKAFRVSVVVPDVRYRFELDAIRSWGGTVLGVIDDPDEVLPEIAALEAEYDTMALLHELPWLPRRYGERYSDEENFAMLTSALDAHPPRPFAQ